MNREFNKPLVEYKNISEADICLNTRKVYPKPMIEEIGKIKTKTLSGPGADFDSGEVNNTGAAS